MRIGDGGAGWLLKSGEPFLIIPDYENSEFRSSVYPEHRLFGAVLEVPLLWEGTPLGVLYVDDEVGRDFTPEHAHRLGIFANQAATSLAYADLASRDQEKLRKLEKIAQATRQIISDLGAMPARKRLNLIAEHTVDILEAESCGVFLVRGDELVLTAGCGHREPDGFQEGKRLKINGNPGSGLTGWVANSGKIFREHGPALVNHPATSGREPNHTKSGQCHSLIAIPLLAGNNKELVGLLRVDNKKGTAGISLESLGFPKEDEWFLTIFAEAVVVAIQAGELVDRLESLITSSPNGIISVDAQGLVKTLNQKAADILGYSEDEVRNWQVELLYADPTEPHRIGAKLHQNGGKLLGHETTVLSKEKEIIPILHSSAWLKDARGERTGSVGYFEDLRKLKRREVLLLQAINRVAREDQLDRGLQRLVELMAERLERSFCSIMLLDEDDEILRVRAGTVRGNPDWQPGSDLRLLISDWPGLRELLDEGRAKVRSAHDEKAGESLRRLSRFLGLGANLHCLLVIPLKIGNRLVGQLDIGVFNSTPNPTFTPEEKELATSVADQVTFLIDRMQVKERRERLLDALDRSSMHIRAENAIPKLLQSIVRLAAELVSCKVGGLFVSKPHLGQLELRSQHGLEDELIGTRIPASEGLVGLAAGRLSTVCIPDEASPEKEQHFAPFDLTRAIAVPLRASGGVEAILLVGDYARSQVFSEADIDILERFAAHAAIALRTARLMDNEERGFSQLAILHQISDYIQSQVGGSQNLDKILNTVLTGVTASYGLGFNRAVLLLVGDAREFLEGRMGVGEIEEFQAREAWRNVERNRFNQFEEYVQLLESDDIRLTTVGQLALSLRLPLATGDPSAWDVFSEVFWTRRSQHVPPGDDRIPAEFRRMFRVTTPLAIVPLQTRNEIRGLLVADNKFTQAPINEEDISSLATFATTAAIAIENSTVLQQVRNGSEQLLSFYRITREIVAGQNPDHILRLIGDKTRQACGAHQVDILLMDKPGLIRQHITVCESYEKKQYNDDWGNEIAYRVMETGEPIPVLEASSGYIPASTSSPQTGDAICLPLSLPGRRIGVMWIRYEHSHRFTETETGVLLLHVNLAATAYDRACRIKALNDMREIAERLAAAADTTSVLDETMRSARQILNARAALFWFYDQGRNNFILDRSVASNIPFEDWERFRNEGPNPNGTAFRLLGLNWCAVPEVESLDSPLGSNTREFLHRIGCQSLQSVSLQVGGERLGVLYAMYPEPQSFGDDERDSALTFANHAALALKKSKLLEQVSRTQRAAAAVAQVMVLGEREQILRSIAQGTKAAVDCDAIVLFEYDRKRRQLIHPPIMEGVLNVVAASSSEELSDYDLVHQMLEKTEPYPVDRVETDPLFQARRFAHTEGIQSCLVVPLRTNDDKIGVMFVNSRSLRRFTQDEITSIQLFANQAAVALESSERYEASVRKSNYLTALYEASRQITADFPLNLSRRQILDRVVQPTMAAITGVSGSHTNLGTIQIFNAERRVLVLESIHPTDFFPDLLARIGEEWSVNRLENGPRIGISGRTVQARLPQRVDDVRIDLDYREFSPATSSELSVPLMDRENVLGVLSVESDEPAAFDKEDERALVALAELVVVAIRNIERLEELRQTQIELDAHTWLAWIGMGAADWHHQLTNDMWTISGHLNLLKGALRWPRLPSPEIAEHIQTIENSADKILQRAIVPLPSDGQGIESLPLNALIRERVVQFQEKRRYDKVVSSASFETSLSLDDAATVRADAYWLSRVLDILIDNAIKACERLPGRAVRLSTRQVGLKAEIIVADTGPGIPEAVLQKLFREPIRKAPGEPGLGVGLLAARAILQLFAGEIRPEPEIPHGTRMLVTLPLGSPLIQSSGEKL